MEGRSFTIKPLDGMEAIQKNFADLCKDGDKAVTQFIGTKKVIGVERYSRDKTLITVEFGKEIPIN